MNGPPDWSRDADYARTKAWVKNYKPLPGKPYTQAHDYAVWRYALVRDHWDSLDNKANDITKYAAAVVAVIGVIASLHPCNSVQKPLLGAGWLVASLALSVIAFAIAVLARKPSGVSIGGDAKELLDFAEDSRITDEKQLDALVAASLHLATVGLRLSTTQKSRLVNWALVALFISILLLSFPLAYCSG